MSDAALRAAERAASTGDPASHRALTALAIRASANGRGTRDPRVLPAHGDVVDADGEARRVLCTGWSRAHGDSPDEEAPLVRVWWHREGHEAEASFSATIAEWREWARGGTVLS